MFATYTHKHVVVQEMRQTWFIQRMPTYSHSTADIVLQKRSVNVVDKTCVMNVGHLSPYTFSRTHSSRHIPPDTFLHSLRHIFSPHHTVRVCIVQITIWQKFNLVNLKLASCVVFMPLTILAQLQQASVIVPVQCFA